MKVEEYRSVLRKLDHWDTYLLRESGLPGPRANLELAQAVAEEGRRELFQRYLAFDAQDAPAGTPHEFLAFCGTVGLGQLLVEGDMQALAILRRLAGDSRWRIREAVTIALQRWGERSMSSLINTMEEWSLGTPLESRAAAAALCEPRLLTNPDHARRVLGILNAITVSLSDIADRKEEGYLALRKALGYCWSVAVAACPGEGKAYMTRWFSSTDPSIRWIMKENLKKNRLARMDPEWVDKWMDKLKS